GPGHHEQTRDASRRRRAAQDRCDADPLRPDRSARDGRAGRARPGTPARAGGRGGGMSCTDVETEVRELQRLVAHHSDRYHVDDDPEIADDEYDELFRRLQALEA